MYKYNQSCDHLSTNKHGCSFPHGGMFLKTNIFLKVKVGITLRAAESIFTACFDLTKAIAHLFCKTNTLVRQIHLILPSCINRITNCKGGN